MRNKKHIALCLMVISLIMLALSVHSFIGGDMAQNQISNNGEVCINEVCCDYFPVSFAEIQPESDWIELYNSSDRSVNLGEYYISDDKNDLHKCNLPEINLAPGDYYVIHSAKGNEVINEEITFNFGISSQGETIYLSKQEGIVEVVNVPATETNTTWSRLKDAEQEWGNTELTYNSSNNQAKRIQEKIDPPVFSVTGGFYAEEFKLELKAEPETLIYYTLDGSDPNVDGVLYEEPILVRDMSEKADVYSVKAGFQDGSVSEKITVVRAIAIDRDGRESSIETNSYMIGKEDNANYSEMYTVSLVSDPDNLFGYDEGIYVPGKRFDEYTTEGGKWEKNNYQIRGKKSERPANIEIFNENGERILNKKAGIRIHGNTTRECDQKSFSVYARDMYDGENTIEDLFGKETIIHKFFIYTNREASKLRDVLIAKMLSNRNMATQSLIYCNVFLDGEYWGIYLLAEVYDEYFFKNHYDIEADNIQIYEGTPPNDVIEYLNIVSDKSEEAVYERLCQMIDVQSFIDYYASMLYLNNSDWLNYNARCYRSIEVGSGRNEDGKWRWGVWDVETTMYNAQVDTFHNGNIFSWEDDLLAQTLMDHEAFRKQFVITYMDLYNTIWQEDNILPIVSELEKNISHSYCMYLERFWEGHERNEFTDKVKTFFSERKEYALEDVKDEFQLKADPVWLVILTNKEGAASFRVNTSTIDIPETWWQGIYFPDYPVELKIEETYENNTFLGWYTEDDKLLSTEDTLTVDLKEETNIICAQFALD